MPSSMSFIWVILRLLKITIAVSLFLIGTVGAWIAIFGAPKFILDDLTRIGESPQANVAWGLVDILITTIWYLLTEDPLLCGIVWLGIAFIWWLYSDKFKRDLKQDYDKVRSSFRNKSGPRNKA